MEKTQIIKKMWEAVYDPNQDTKAVIEAYFHPDYTQCINGLTLTRPDYIDHVIAQKENMSVTHIAYLHALEKDDELFALYKPFALAHDGSHIEAEVISHFLFKGDQVFRIHGQVRLITGDYAHVDMEGEKQS